MDLSDCNNIEHQNFKRILQHKEFMDLSDCNNI